MTKAVLLGWFDVRKDSRWHPPDATPPRQGPVTGRVGLRSCRPWHELAGGPGRARTAQTPAPHAGMAKPREREGCGARSGDGDARGAGTASCRPPPSRPGLRPALAPTGPRHTATCPSTPGAPTPDAKASSPPASFQKRGTMNSAFCVKLSAVSVQVRAGCCPTQWPGPRHGATGHHGPDTCSDGPRCRGTGRVSGFVMKKTCI